MPDPTATPERIRELIVGDAQVDTGALTTALTRHGTPLITDDPDNPDRQRMLFTWWPSRDPVLPDGKELAGVYVWVNRLTDKEHADAGLMRRVPGTDVWFTEISVPRDTMAGYRIYPFAADGPGVTDGRVEYSRAVVAHALIDSRNNLVRSRSPFGSVARCVSAPGLDAWTGPHSATITETTGEVSVAGESGIRYRLGVPDTADPAPINLLITFDAEKWCDRYQLAQVLDHLYRRGRLGERFAVLGLHSPPGSGDRLRFLGGNHGVLDALVGSVLPQAHRHLPAPPPSTVVAGQSLGGLAALSFGSWYPESVDRVLAYSPSVWFRPGLHARPADVSGRQEWIHHQLRDAGRASASLPRLYLAVGDFEGQLAPNVTEAAETADAAGFPLTFRTYSGGHDDSWWASMLLEDLADRRGGPALPGPATHFPATDTEC
ncbi:DUF3327 domain-containing protein [Gordonia pseudamarae]|uniref:DUF3327 domain-containing protein n=1 Tax=Gordonia pseudamarae TaxID=2831662 RepID=A0ABX6IFP3_9ACTN|nr:MULTISPECIES: enterochelin esterase domain-containing protein [Gordonia]MBD0020409.1 DUF3327 domain-containing protein [Gordonia sp. (in: high G+C Gram-positive bacteria)]QHN25734.1 DUF3327 domain-containing protein [Gordonia pseudamarae]QHN34666.1 DUF3327 domain-containing protein [Gordonia pseudamarae]